MDVFSCKCSFPFIIIISCSALLSQSTEITKDNCRNNRTFLSQCSFHISLQPPLTEKLECFLTFPKKTNNSVTFSGGSIVLQRKIEQKCPHYFVEIKTQDERLQGFFITCQLTLGKFSTTFHNFTWSHIFYDNKGLIDNSTIIKNQLKLETGKPCDDFHSKTLDFKNHRSWIIILSAVGFVVLIIVCAIIVYLYRVKGNKRKAQNSLLMEDSSVTKEPLEDQC